MSYAPEFLFGADEWCGNSQRFATREEAERSAKKRFASWTIPSDWRVVESTHPVNYFNKDGVDFYDPKTG